jgi:hypothetical protein
MKKLEPPHALTANGDDRRIHPPIDHGENPNQPIHRKPLEPAPAQIRQPRRIDPQRRSGNMEIGLTRDADNRIRQLSLERRYGIVEHERFYTPTRRAAASPHCH